ncbi:Gfo/Idh/MocA family oxidoreductase [Streptomyces misionensis]|uniref:Gfo/Idh/MocA family protein n=1 Tax=Streptomyces misionensis TaxID=67331 RepID=UPI00341028BB
MALGVGIVGINPDRGWARESHAPAVAHLDGLTLVAVASRRGDQARRAARELGAATGYGDARELIEDPAVDIVGVAASVPAHRELILTAARAGKHLYSEWPLGVDATEADDIAAATATAGVHTAVGLQARAHPAVVEAARLVAEGRIGRVLSISVQSTTAGFGPVVPADEFYLEDAATGMNLTTIQAMHTLDLIERVVGPWEELAAQLDTQFPELAVGDERRPERRTLPDHVLVTGRAGGTPVSVEVAGGRPPSDTPFALTVVGDRGKLQLRGGAPRGFQAGVLTLSLDGEPHPVNLGELAGLPDSAVNVAATLASLRDDIVAGTRRTADFEHGRTLAHLVDTLRSSDAQGRRLPAPNR